MTVIGINQTLVKVYDSLYRCLAPCVSMQAASIMKSASDFITFHVESTQMQQGGIDCGLFAITYATEFCFGNNPECYRYEQTSMRQHFVACIEDGKMKPFPSTLVRPKRPVKVQKVQLHCDCLLPEDGEEPMAFCHTCRKWYHKSCQSIPDVVFDRSYKLNWFCSHCA